MCIEKYWRKALKSSLCFNTYYEFQADVESGRYLAELNSIRFTVSCAV